MVSMINRDSNKNQTIVDADRNPNVLCRYVKPFLFFLSHSFTLSLEIKFTKIYNLPLKLNSCESEKNRTAFALQGLLLFLFRRLGKALTLNKFFLSITIIGSFIL